MTLLVSVIFGDLALLTFPVCLIGQSPTAVLVGTSPLSRRDTGQRLSAQPLWRSVCREGLRSNCSRQMLCPLSGGRWVMKEVVGVAVQEEVTFVSMPREDVNSEGMSELFK